MDWITPSVALGGIVDLPTAVRYPVTAVLSLVVVPSGEVPPDIDHLVVPLADGAGNHPSDVKRAVRFACDFLRDEEPLFIHCHAGRSRSVVVLAMALMRQHRISRAEAMNLIARRRQIGLTPGIEDMFRFADV